MRKRKSEFKFEINKESEFKFEINKYNNNLDIMKRGKNQVTFQSNFDTGLVQFAFGDIGTAVATASGQKVNMGHDGIVLRPTHSSGSAHYYASSGGVLINSGVSPTDNVEQCVLGDGNDVSCRGQGQSLDEQKKSRASGKGEFIVMGFEQTANQFCGPAACVNHHVAKTWGAKQLDKKKYNQIPKWKKM